MTQLSTTNVLRNALEAFRSIASQPISTDPYVALQWEMAGAHVLFVHVLLAIYEVRSNDIEMHLLGLYGIASESDT